MTSNPIRTDSLSSDVWRLIFEGLAGDTKSLCNVGLTCRAWRFLSLPCLLKIVDLSSHNNGRQPEHESSIQPVLYADFSAAYRPRNLVPRQRAFLELITARSSLAKYVKSLAWTLVWKDFEDSVLTKIDRETWNVFSQMKNVTQLDLASLHEIGDDDFIRDNPTQLFPAVTDLRLLGWMHRGLVRAIVTTLDTRKLRSLKLDYLEDEGALPNGAPMDIDLFEQCAHTARKTDSSDTVDDELFHRQEAGEACVFPGPMWLPLRLLSAYPLDSLTHLQVKVAPLSMDIDLRNYHTLFRETIKLMLKARESLRSLVVVFGEFPYLYEENIRPSLCATWLGRIRHTYRPWFIKMAATFLNQALAALSQSSFPYLDNIDFEGFTILEAATPHEAAAAQLAGIFQSIRDCAFTNASFTKTSSVDHRLSFKGFDYKTPHLEGLSNILRSS